MSRIIKVLLAFIAFFCLNFIVQGQFDYEGRPIDEWTLSDGNEMRSITVPFTEKNKEAKVYTLETIVESDHYDTLIIPQILGYALKVYANEQLVYRNGSFEEPTSNIWNKTHLIPLEQFGDESIDLKIQTYALHDVGVLNMIYLAEYEEIYQDVSIQNFLFVSMIFVLFGGYVAVGILLLLVARKSRMHFKKEDMSLFTYFGLACFSFAIFIMDGGVRMSTGPLYMLLFVRKITYIGLYTGTYFLLVGIRRYMHNKSTPKWVMGVCSFFIIGILVAPDFHFLDVTLNYMSLILFVVLFYIIGISLRSKIKTNMTFSGVFLFITSIHGILVHLGILSGNYLFQYGLFVYMMAIGYIVAYKYEVIEEESIALNKKMLIDPLTKAYNRGYIATLTMSGKDLAMFIDLDKFKQFNDTHGHDKGDDLLIFIVQLFKKVMGKEVEIIRYGGDEFVLILRNFEVSSVESLMGAIKQQLQNRYADADFSYGFIEYEGNITDTLIQADHLMYSMKKSKNADDGTR